MPRVKSKKERPASAAELLRPPSLEPEPRELQQPARHEDGTLQAGEHQLLAKDLKHVVALARSKTTDAINTLHGMMLNEKVSPNVRALCANSLLDRGWGTAPKRVVFGADLGDGLTPMEVPTAKLEQLAGELARRSANTVEATLKLKESLHEDSSDTDAAGIG